MQSAYRSSADAGFGAYLAELASCLLLPTASSLEAWEAAGCACAMEPDLACVCGWACPTGVPSAAYSNIVLQIKSLAKAHSMLFVSLFCKGKYR